MGIVVIESDASISILPSSFSLVLILPTFPVKDSLQALFRTLTALDASIIKPGILCSTQILVGLAASLVSFSAVSNPRARDSSSNLAISSMILSSTMGISSSTVSNSLEFFKPIMWGVSYFTSSSTEPEPFSAGMTITSSSSFAADVNLTALHCPFILAFNLSIALSINLSSMQQFIG